MLTISESLKNFLGDFFGLFGLDVWIAVDNVFDPLFLDWPVWAFHVIDKNREVCPISMCGTRGI